MTSTQRTISRAQNRVSRSARWTPNIGLFEISKKATTLDAWAKAEKARQEYEALGCELRYKQELFAGQLAGWQEDHVRSGREMLKVLAREMIVKEKERLEGLRRALEGTKKETQPQYPLSSTVYLTTDDLREYWRADRHVEGSCITGCGPTNI
ncbi:hypothetical protein LTR95_002184 [Oleoguttula sp. CCFEE 5521]